MIHKNWAELIKPTQLEVKPGADSARVATVVAEPLERGFGLTLGNALRRVLLSSLQGGAITSVQIDNVLHEFSSVPGVREDVTDIVLNVKAMGLKMHGEGPKRMRLKATGPGEITAGMIETGHDIEIMDPDHVICHVDKGGKLAIEMTVQSGKGYVPAALNNLIGLKASKGLISTAGVVPACQGRAATLPQFPNKTGGQASRFHTSSVSLCQAMSLSSAKPKPRSPTTCTCSCLPCTLRMSL